LDVDPMSGNVTAESAASGLARFRDAKAVVIMDWGGTPCEYARIASECGRHNATVILDAAQSFGSTCGGLLIPKEIEYVCYSFGPTKLLSAVEGGAIATRNRAAEHRLKALRWYGIQRESRDSSRLWEYGVEELGNRYVTNNICATVALPNALSHQIKAAYSATDG
jgi:dTDP-4-amino-4,6-dideoxygalactose transaminase